MTMESLVMMFADTGSGCKRNCRLPGSLAFQQGQWSVWLGHKGNAFTGMGWGWVCGVQIATYRTTTRLLFIPLLPTTRKR